MRLSERSITMALLTIAFAVFPALTALGQEPTPLSLAEAVAYALEHNPTIAAAAARVSAGDANVALAHSGAQPAFTLRGSGRLQGPPQEIKISFPPPGHTIRINRARQGTVAAGVVWPLWTGGRVEAATGAARAQLDAAEGDLQQATEQLLYEVGAVYYRVLGARSARAAAEAGVERAEEELRAAGEARTAGALTGSDVSAATAAYRQAEQALVAAENVVADAEQSLNRLLGRQLDEPVRLVEEPVVVEPAPRLDEAVAVALTTRPELLALADRREAAEAAISQARAERNPTISAVGEAALQTPTDVMRNHAEFVGLEFSWPILNHPAARARERVARATVQELEETQRDLESAIAFQVRESERRLADAREALASAQEALQAAEDSARQARVSYQLGAATRRELVAAEATLEENRARLTQAQHGVSVALLSQARALGLLRTLFLAPAEEVGQP